MPIGYIPSCESLERGEGIGGICDLPYGIQFLGAFILSLVINIIYMKNE